MYAIRFLTEDEDGGYLWAIATEDVPGDGPRFLLTGLEDALLIDSEVAAWGLIWSQELAAAPVWVNPTRERLSLLSILDIESL